MKQEIIIHRIIPPGNLREFRRKKEIIRHKLHHQRHIHMHRPLQLGQSANIAGRHLKKQILLKPLRGNHIPQQVNNLLPLRRHLHFHQRVIQKIPAILRRRRTHIIGGAQSKQLHRRQARIRISKQLFNVREVCHIMIKQTTVRSMSNRLIKRMCTHPNRRPTQIIFADIDRIQRRIPGIAPTRKNIGIGDGILMQRVFRHVILRINHILHALKLLMVRLDHKKHIVARVGHLAKGRNQRRFIGIANVILRTIRAIAPIHRPQRHLTGVQVRPMRFFRKTKGKDRALLQQPRRLVLHRLIVAHPNWTQPQHRNLPGIPITQAIKPQNLVKRANTKGIPTGIGRAVPGRSHQNAKSILLFDKFDKIIVPNALVVVGLQPSLPFRLKEGDGFKHQVA